MHVCAYIFACRYMKRLHEKKKFNLSVRKEKETRWRKMLVDRKKISDEITKKNNKQHDSQMSEKFKIERIS